MDKADEEGLNRIKKETPQKKAQWKEVREDEEPRVRKSAGS